MMLSLLFAPCILTSTSLACHSFSGRSGAGSGAPSDRSRSRQSSSGGAAGRVQLPLLPKLDHHRGSGRGARAERREVAARPGASLTELPHLRRPVQGGKKKGGGVEIDTEEGFGRRYV